MKHLILFVALLMASSINAQSNYQEDMQKALGLWGENKPVEAINVFERIAKAENAHWLPLYYAAQINIFNSFGETNEDKLASQLNEAQGFINKAKAISPNNPELLVLQAMLYTAWVAFDADTYGMDLSAKVADLYAKAEQLAPENPRVVYGKAEWNMGYAQYFNQDTSVFCKDLERSLELFAKFKAETSFHPNWGKDRAEALLQTCRK